MQLQIVIPEAEAKEIETQAAFELRSPQEIIRRAFEFYQKRSLAADELELAKLRQDKKTLMEANKNQQDSIGQLQAKLEETEVNLQSMVMERDFLLSERKKAETENLELQQQIEDYTKTVTVVSRLNTEIAKILKGEPENQKMHDWSDLPKMVKDQQHSLVVARTELSNILNLAQDLEIKSIEVRAKIGLGQGD